MEQLGNAPGNTAQIADDEINNRVENAAGGIKNGTENNIEEGKTGAGNTIISVNMIGRRTRKSGEVLNAWNMFSKLGIDAGI